MNIPNNLYRVDIEEFIKSISNLETPVIVYNLNQLDITI